MPFNYEMLRYYGRGGDLEQAESPAARLRFYDMVSNSCCIRMLLTMG